MSSNSTYTLISDCLTSTNVASLYDPHRNKSNKNHSINFHQTNEKELISPSIQTKIKTTCTRYVTETEGSSHRKKIIEITTI